MGFSLNYFAFTATGTAEFQTRLSAHVIRFRTVSDPTHGRTTINLWDADGNHIHGDFVNRVSALRGTARLLPHFRLKR